MYWNDMVDVLTVVAINDRRTVGESDVHWWLALADDGQWPSKEFALASIVRHANDRPGVWLEPGHITAYWHALRREANETFLAPGPTRDNIEDPEAQRIAREQAFQEHLNAHLDHFIAPQRRRLAMLERRVEDDRLGR